MPDMLAVHAESPPTQENRVTAQSLFTEFLSEQREVLKPWTNQVLRDVLKHSSSIQENRYARAQTLFRQLSDTSEKDTLDRQTLRTLKGISSKSADSRISQEITDLENNETPQKLVDIFKKTNQAAFGLKMKPGLMEGRTEYANRGALAQFIEFIVSKGYTKIGVMVGDMDGLKAYNTLTDELGDCGVLTIFHASDQEIEKMGGVMFIPNQGGGDDIVAIFVDVPDEQLEKVGNNINHAIEREVPDIRAYTQGKIFGQPLEFMLTGEKKQLSAETVQALETKVGNRRIKGPRLSTYTQTISNLNPTNPVDEFFNHFNEMHKQLNKTKKTQGPKRGDIIDFLGESIRAESPAPPENISSLPKSA